MRILHISTRLILGGSQENTVVSCEGQAALGHEVHLAFGPIYGPEGSLLQRVERFRTPDGRGITTHVVPHLVRQISPWSDALCYRELRRLIRDLKPDIVHTHSSKAGFLGRAAAWAVAQAKRPKHQMATPPDGAPDRTREPFGKLETRPFGNLAIVHTIHGPPFHQYQSRLTHRLYVASERFAARRCHLIVSVADAMTRQYLAEGIGRPEQYATVYSGMDTESFLTPAPGQSRDDIRARLGLAPADFVIGTVARLAELKGHDDLLDALAPDLKAKPNWKLLWVGNGWWRERLLNKARSLGLSVADLDRESAPRSQLLTSSPAQVLLTGLIPPDAVPGYIRAMDVLAHPSYREGLPRTVPQSLLCGVCPVAYDVDGTAEVIRDGQTGRLVKPGDLPALRTAIEQLAADPAARASMAARGRDECRDRFSAQRMVRDLQSVYHRALQLAAQTPPR